MADEERIQWDMFANYEDWENAPIPDNRGRICVGEPEQRDIIYKGTNSIIFSVLGLEIDDIASLELGMQSGINLIFTKTLDDVSLTKAGPDLYVEYVLTADESSEIDPKRDFRVQGKFTLINGDVIYTPIMRYRVKPVLF